MLNANPNAPNTMKETLRPMFGKVFVIKGIWERWRKSRMGVSQKDGPMGGLGWGRRGGDEKKNMYHGGR